MAAGNQKIRKVKKLSQKLKLATDPLEGDLEAYRYAFTDWLAGAIAGLEYAPVKKLHGSDMMHDVFQTAVSGHYLDFDDTYLPGMVHLSVPVAPAALITGAFHKATVGEVVQAYARGLESMGRFSRATNPAMYELGWHSTTVCGVVGSAVASASFLCPSAVNEAALLSLTGAGGVLASFGSDAKSVQVGLSALTGVSAAIAASAGATTEAGLVNKDSGVIQYYTGGRPYEFDDDVAIEQNWLKAYPCCLQTHTTVEASLIARKRASGPISGPMRLRVSPLARKAASYDEVETPLQAKFSISYVCALTLLTGAPEVSSFDVLNEEAQALARQIEIIVDPSLKEPEIVLQTVPGDSSTEIYIDRALGSPQRPMTSEELSVKTKSLTGIDLLDFTADPSRTAADLVAKLHDHQQRVPNRH